MIRLINLLVNYLLGYSPAATRRLGTLRERTGVSAEAIQAYWQAIEEETK